jgi:hypothetical protein
MMVCHVIAGAAASKTLSVNDLLRLLAGGEYNARITSLVRHRGINFVPTTHDRELLQRAGANEALIHEVMTAPHVLPQVTQHLPEPPPRFHVKLRSIDNGIISTGHNALDVRQAASNSSKSSVTIPSQKPAAPKLEASAMVSTTLPVGTTITARNWRQYIQYMPFGMSELFEDRYFWRMPSDIAIVIGPTIPEKMPTAYDEATKRHSGNEPETRGTEGQQKYIGAFVN